MTVRLTRLPNVPTRSLLTAVPNRSQVKLVSSDSGAFAIRYQRQQSAGSSSSASDMNTPRCSDVENLPP